MPPPTGVFVHELALCESQHVGRGTRIWAHAHVMEGARVGRECKIGEGCFIESGAVIGDYCTVKNGVSVWERVTCEDYVFLGPEVTLTNDLVPRAAFETNRTTGLTDTLIREGASIGANATIVCGVIIGRHAMVGAGAVVTRDVPDFSLVLGSPARPVGWVGRFGTRLHFDSDGIAACPDTGDVYRLEDGAVTLERMGIPPSRLPLEPAG